MRLVDIYIAENMVVFKGLQAGGYIARGFVVEAPDYHNVEVDWLNDLEDDLRIILASLQENVRLQIGWTVDSDYRKELLRYKAETENFGNEWVRRQRDERFVRYWERMEGRTLRREKLYFFFTSKIDASVIPKGVVRRKAYQYLLDVASRDFVRYQEVLELTFASNGGSVTPMNDQDLFTHYYKYFNPSAVDNFKLDLAALFQPLEEVCGQCLNSEQVPVERPDYGFYQDGYYHSFLVLKTLPKQTWQGMSAQITDLRMLDYRVTINIQKLSVEKEIEKTEGEYEILMRAQKGAPKLRMDSAIQLKRDKVARLASNRLTPFSAQFIIHAWDRTKPGLSAKMSALKSAVAKMQGCQSYEPGLPTSARNYQYTAVPGWCWDKYRDFHHYIDDSNLANLLPVSSSSCGSLQDAEALYDGPNGELVGVSSFNGQSPAHGLCFGSTGSGKSVTLFDYCTQTSGYYEEGFTLIVDFGNSWGIFGQTLDESSRPIIIQPNGNVTFNYLDTCGLPLSSMQLANATAIVQLMIGKSSDEDKDRMREAFISNTIKGLYADTFEDWKRRHLEEYKQVCREAYAIFLWQSRMTKEYTWLDTYLELKEMERDNQLSEFLEFAAGLEDNDVRMFALNPETAQYVLNLAFTRITPEQMPRHSLLCETLMLRGSDSADKNEREKDEFLLLSSLLEPWCYNGKYGAILDGVSNVNFKGAIAHFELGVIPRSAEDLLSIAAFLITNQAMNEIMQRPRRLKKRVILEELGAFLTIPHGEKITADFYERARKYNTWVLSIIQNYRKFRQFKVSETVTSNAKMVFMLRQNDRGDLDAIAEPFPIPDFTKQVIMRMPDASRMMENPYGGFVVFEHYERRPRITVGRNYASREMLYASNSSGEHYDIRQRQLRGPGSITEKIIKSAATAP